MRLEHNPSYGNFPGENGEVRYGEGVLDGLPLVRDARRSPVRFPFGHGLVVHDVRRSARRRSSSPTFAIGGTLEVAVDVTNIGARRGAEVVQCYVEPVAPSRFRPVRELRAFEKVWLDPGEQRTVRLVLDDRAFATWSATAHDWQVDPGEYDVAIGRSSADIVHRARLTISR